jgi:hypothetical protein
VLNRAALERPAQQQTRCRIEDFRERVDQAPPVGNKSTVKRSLTACRSRRGASAATSVRR